MAHPIRDAKVHVFQRVDSNEGGVQFIARLSPYKTYPVISQGGTQEEAVNSLESLRTEAIEKHEADVIRRQEASARAKTKAAEKKAAKEPTT